MNKLHALCDRIDAANDAAGKLAAALEVFAENREAIVQDAEAVGIRPNAVRKMLARVSFTLHPAEDGGEDTQTAETEPKNGQSASRETPVSENADGPVAKHKPPPRPASEDELCDIPAFLVRKQGDHATDGEQSDA